MTDERILAELRRQNALLEESNRRHKKATSFSLARVGALTLIVLIILLLVAL